MVLGITHTVTLPALRSSRCRQAVTLATDFGPRPLVATAISAPASCISHIGEWQEAREHLSKATTMYGEITMFWLEQAAELTPGSG